MSDRTQAFLLVRSGGRPLGLGVEALEEVCEPAPVAMVPTRSGAVRGVRRVRGTLVPVRSSTSSSAQRMATGEDGSNRMVSCMQRCTKSGSVRTRSRSSGCSEHQVKMRCSVRVNAVADVCAPARR